MSSRRSLKKKINKTVELLYADCFFYQTFMVNADKIAGDKVILKIVDTQSDFLSRVNVNEGKGAKGRVQQYFKKLNADFTTQVNELGKAIEALP